MGEMGAILKPAAGPPFRVSDMIFEQPPIMFPHLAHADLKKSNTAPTHLHKIRRKKQVYRRISIHFESFEVLL